MHPILIAMVISLAGQPDEWKATEILNVGEKAGIGGVCLGNFDATADGLEIGAFAGDGRVFVILRDGEAWKDRMIHKAAGELIQGRAFPRDGGSHGIAAVGMVTGPESDTKGPGTAVLLLPGNPWRSEVLWKPDRCGHGVVVADLIPEIPGPEVAAADFGGRVAICRRPGDAVVIHEGSDRAKALAAADLSEDREGLDIVCAYASGEVVLIPGGTIYRREAGASRLAVGKEGIVCGFDDGAVVVIRRSEEGWEGKEVLRAPKKIRGVAVGDFGIAAAAKDGTVRIVKEGEEGGIIIFQGTHPLHDLAAGDILPGAGGEELVTGGYGGKVTILSRK